MALMWFSPRRVLRCYANEVVGHPSLEEHAPGAAPGTGIVEYRLQVPPKCWKTDLAAPLVDCARNPHPKKIPRHSRIREFVHREVRQIGSRSHP